MRLMTSVLLLALAGCAADRAGGAAPAAGVAPPPLDGLDRLVHAETNAARQRSGLRALRWSGRLARVARSHSEDMARRGFFAHLSPEGTTPGDRAEAGGVRCLRAVGVGEVRPGVLENLYQTTRYTHVTVRAFGNARTREAEWYTADLVADAAVQGWLGSPAHRVNLLDRFVAAEGVGVAVSRDSLVIVTQVLC